MTDHELVGIRECARRLGVSDTAVHKAIKAGRVVAHEDDRDPKNGRPRLRWPQAQQDWLRNSDSTKRTHVGATGTSPARAKYADPGAAPALPTRAQAMAGDGPAQHDDGAVAPDAPAGRGGAVQGPSLAQSKAIREAYMARLAKLEYEREVGKLVSADEVKARWFKHINSAKTRIMGIPAACKSRVADLPLAVVAAIEAVCREALEDLANGRD